MTRETTYFTMEFILGIGMKRCGGCRRANVAAHLVCRTCGRRMVTRPRRAKPTVERRLERAQIGLDGAIDTAFTAMARVVRLRKQVAKYTRQVAAHTAKASTLAVTREIDIE